MRKMPVRPLEVVSSERPSAWAAVVIVVAGVGVDVMPYVGNVMICYN